MDHPARQLKLRSALGENRLDALLITHLPNVLYLCGFTGSAAALLLTEKESVFFSDGRYTAQAKAEVRGARIVIAGKAPLTSAGGWLASKRPRLSRNRQRRLGVEAEHLTVAAYRRFAKLVESDFRLGSAPALVEQARMVKDSDEVDRIRAAATLGATLFDTALDAIRPGIKEAEVAAEMEYAARKAGADGMSFPTIIASGKRSALPHGQASAAAIPARGFVVCDFGVILTGYCSDRTRTVHVGRPSQQARRVYEAVQAAQQAALDAVRPGTSVGQVDRAARKVLQKQGLAKYFTHSTGHGVGLEIHEAPRVAAGQSEILRPGMVITVEPGVYLPGQWGIRIEDMVLVTERGCEVLAPGNKELMAL